MTYPLQRPIWTYRDAANAFPTLSDWIPHYDGHDGEVADRLTEILVFRACKMWHKLEDRKPCPAKFEPVVILNWDDPVLLVPGLRVSHFKGCMKQTRTRGRGARFFADPVCLNPLGSMEAAKLFRKAFVERFPVLPKLPLWQEAEEVLDRLLTPSHRFRRATSLLDLRTAPCAATTTPRRL